MFNTRMRHIPLKPWVLRSSHFDAKFLGKCEANYAPLSPLSPFRRTVRLFPHKMAYVYGDMSRTWGEVGQRISQFASALHNVGIGKGDVVSIISPNTPAMYESHFAVPGVEAVLHSINTRLDATTIAFQLNHCKAKLVLVDNEFTQLMTDVRDIMKSKQHPVPMFINIFDKEHVENVVDVMKEDVELLGTMDYEDFLSSGDSKFELRSVKDEFDAISLNYTSGTTGSPKGVVTHYRGAYLNSIANQVEWDMKKFSRFLWVVPMFHCNGWCFPWTMANCAGTSYFTRQVRAETMFELIEKHKIQYFGAAPVVLNTMLTHPNRRYINHEVKMWVAGSPPAPSVMEQFAQEIGIKVQTAYGLTESYGPIATYQFDQAWAAKNPDGTLSNPVGMDGMDGTAEDKLADNSKLVVQCPDMTVEDVRVLHPETLVEVPADGVTIGEVMIRGNIIMKGYLDNETATAEAFKDGWFHTGDLGVSHGNGRFELKDRSKDIIISGGENIASVEVETIMMRHPAILEVGVVAMPDTKWQEVPCAFVALKPQYLPSAATTEGVKPEKAPTEKELIAWCRTKMARYMAPKKIVFTELPKTTTGKIQKNVLRDIVRKW